MMDHEITIGDDDGDDDEEDRNNDNGDDTVVRLDGRQQQQQQQQQQLDVPYDLLDGIELYGWTPNPKLSMDDNLMDLTLLVTRSSQLRQGSMACLLVQPGYDENGESDNKKPTDVRSMLVSVATNKSLYKPNDSDVHAEIVAIASAARHGRQTDGTTAFITMPPCKKCLGALVHAGITRIVSRYPFQNKNSNSNTGATGTTQKEDQRIVVCREANITYVDFEKRRSDECEQRVRTLINNCRGPANVESAIDIAADIIVEGEKRRQARSEMKKQRPQNKKRRKLQPQDGEQIEEKQTTKVITADAGGSCGGGQDKA